MDYLDCLGTEQKLRKLFKSTLNNRLHRNLACAIDESSRGAKLKRAFEELPIACVNFIYARFLKCEMEGEHAVLCSEMNTQA